nr:unnamed protein product [Spirometra erinaceieuropaei]
MSSPEDLVKLQMLQQQQQQQSSNYDSSLSFASPVPLMLRGRCYLDPYAAAPSDRVPVSDLSRHQSLAPTIMSPLLPAPPPASSVALAAPSSIAVPQQPPSLPPPAAVAAPTSGFYPPPPDQPLPPLPPATPVSASAANSLLSSGARNSTINPYAASSLNGFLVDDNGMVVSTHTGPVLNNVGGGLPAVANAGAYPFMLPAGYLARLPPTQGAAHDGVLFPASEQHQAATCAANTWYPANYASEHLPPHHSNRRAPAFISSDTLRSIDTLPRDPPSISHPPPPLSFCKPLPSRFPANGDNNGEVFDSTCAQR